jgi:hypothetical protein
MTVVEKNIRSWAEEYDYKEEVYNFGKLEGKLEGKFESQIEMIRNAYNYKFSIEEIMKISGLDKEKVISIIKNFK